MARLPRWIPVLLAAVALAVIPVAGAGCGENASSATPTTTVSTPGTAVTQAPSSIQEIVGTKLVSTSETPAEVRDALDQHLPIVVLFYVAGGADDQPVRDALENLRPKHPDVTFAVYEYKAAEQYGNLAATLKVDYPPEAIFIDSNGVIRQILSGYVDEAVLNQSLVNVGQE